MAVRELMTRRACQRLNVGEALADARAAADALSHQRQLVDGAGDVTVAQRRRDMREPGVEDERLGFAEASTTPCRKRIKNAV